ncbi:hypothetical protein PENTCL1PPCAC_24790, partial [Pristionchus entomophagus]
QVSNNFHIAEVQWGKIEAVLFSDIVDAQKGFILDDKVLVEAHVSVKAVKGIKKGFQFDFSKAGPDSIALNVAGEKLYVSKEFLAIESPFFVDLFKKDNDDKESEIELKDVSVKDFTELLLATYPSNKAITADTYKSLLELVERFKLQRAMDKAETYLIKTKKQTVSAKLVLSEEYKLAKLQLHCIHSLETVEAVKALESTPEFKKFSEDLKNALFTRILALIK